VHLSDGEDLADVDLQLSLLLHLDLLDALAVQVLQRVHVLHQAQLRARVEQTQRAVVVLLRLGHLALLDLQVTEQLSTRLVSRIPCVNLQLVYTVCVVVAGIASNLHRITDIQILEAPFIVVATFFYMVHKLQSLNVFVSFAVELKVGLQVGLVGAQVTHVGTAGYRDVLALVHFGSVMLQVLM